MTDKNNEKKDQFHKGGIFTDTVWSDDTSKRKLFSLERNNNYVRMGVRRWDNETGKFNFKMSAGLSINWNDRMKLLRQLLNMKKSVEYINTAEIEADKMYYECSISNRNGEILFQVKTDKNCNPIAGITIKTEEASEFYVFGNNDSFVTSEIKNNEVPTIDSVSSVVDKVDDLYTSAKSYFYDFAVRDTFLSKMLGGDKGDKNYKEVDEDSPF